MPMRVHSFVTISVPISEIETYLSSLVARALMLIIVYDNGERYAGRAMEAYLL